VSIHEHPSGADHEAGECADFLERIVYLLDGELDDADCSVVHAHLEECGPCLARYDLQRTVKAVVARSCSESAPDSLRQRVLVQVREVQVRISRGDVD
jgi:mycothiol system anti-sigma-R factor